MFLWVPLGLSYIMYFSGKSENSYLACFIENGQQKV